MTPNNKDSAPININISLTTIVKILAVLLLLWFVYAVKEIFAILFVALILASAFDPWVDWLQKRKLPRGIGVLLIYLVLFLVLGSAVVLLIPPISEQVKELSSNFPEYWGKLVSGFRVLSEYSAEHGFMDEAQKVLSSVEKFSSRAAGGVFSFLTGAFGGVVAFFLALVLTFYITVEEQALKRLVKSVTPDKYQPYVIRLIARIQNKIGRWLRGQLVLCLIIGVLVYIGLLVLGVKYALVLALLAAIFELIPYLGPTLGAIPAVLLAFTQSPFKALLVIILYFVIQQLENNLIVPKVMQKAVGLNPIITIVVLLIGAKLGGVFGALLAIPLATAASVFVKDFFDNRDFDEEEVA
ncbi:MAG: AI-2E family transporter [bacterium]